MIKIPFLFNLLCLKKQTRIFIDGGFSLDNLPSPVVIEEHIKVTKSKDISKMFLQPAARPEAPFVEEAGKAPSAVRHEKPPQLPEDPVVVGRISPVSPSGGVLPPSSSSCETCKTTSHYCQIFVGSHLVDTLIINIRENKTN